LRGCLRFLYLLGLLFDASQGREGNTGGAGEYEHHTRDGEPEADPTASDTTPATMTPSGFSP